MNKIIYLLAIMLFVLSGCDESSPFTATEEQFPEGSLNAKTQSLIANSITVVWEKVTNAQHYELLLNKEMSLITQKLEYTFTGLVPGTAYSITVTPVSKDGNRGTPEKIMAKTPNKEVMTENSSLIIDPFLVAPLTAIVRIGASDLSPQDVKSINVKVRGKPNGGIAIKGTMYPQTDQFKHHFFDLSKEKTFNGVIISHQDSVEIPVLGLYADYDNIVDYEVKTNTCTYKGSKTIFTDALPDKNLTVEVDVCQPEKMEPGEVTWVTGDKYNYDFMFDKTGAVRWIINVRGNSDLRILRNGNILVRPFWRASNFGEYTFLGEEVNTWNLSSEFKNHHDIYEMPSGNFLVAVSRLQPREEGYTTNQDGMLEIDRTTHAVVNYWDLFELMDIKNLKAVWLANTPGDWYHMNGLWYDEVNDEIIVSGKHGGILKLSRNGENGDVVNKNKGIVWLMPYFDEYSVYTTHDATKDYVLTAVDASGNSYVNQSIYHDDFHWASDQHNPQIIPSDDGLLHFLIFNNQYDLGNKRSAMVEYAVNETLSSVRQVWEYGKDRADFFAPDRSGATWFPITNNRMILPNRTRDPKVEVTISREVVFEYRILPTVSAKWYRTGRINLYPIKTE